MAIQHEAELYLPIKQFLEQHGYEVKSEVKNCDVVAIRPGEMPCIIELKKTFNLPLLIQAIDRLKISNRVYVAVELIHTSRGPYGQKWSDITRLCRMLGIGLITVQFFKRKSPAVMIQCDPKPYVPPHSVKRFNALLGEFAERSGDYNVGGTTRQPIVTVYREQSLHIANKIKEHGQLSVKELREQTGIPKSAFILQNNYYGWFERVKRGTYALTVKGEKALETYSKVMEIGRQKDN